MITQEALAREQHEWLLWAKHEGGAKGERQERQRQESSPSEPDRKGRTDVEISQHLSAQNKSALIEQIWAQAQSWAQAQLPWGRMSPHKAQGQRAELDAAPKRDNMPIVLLMEASSKVWQLHCVTLRPRGRRDCRLCCCRYNPYSCEAQWVFCTGQKCWRLLIFRQIPGSLQCLGRFGWQKMDEWKFGVRWRSSQEVEVRCSLLLALFSASSSTILLCLGYLLSAWI